VVVDKDSMYSIFYPFYNLLVIGKWIDSIKKLEKREIETKNSGF